MQVEISAAPPDSVTADVLGAAIVEGEGLSPALGDALVARVGRLVERGELSPHVGSLALLDLDGDAPRTLAAAGAGGRESLDLEALRAAAAAVGRHAAGRHASVAWLLDPALPLSLGEQARAAVEGVAFGAYDPGAWRSARSRREVPSLTILTGDEPAAAAARRAGLIAGFTALARDLANAPPNLLTPAALADHAASLEGVEVEVLGPDRLRELGMGAFLAVGGGSANEPRLIVLRHEPARPARPEVVLGLVGKAITFDAGGISIKPALRMHEMKADMSGGAAVVAAMGAIAALELPVRVVAVVAACENLLGSGAFRPGDILTAANGKTIEIVNTDAEGRLVLADALWYAREQGATHVVDIATLTGAMSLALGDYYAGMFANDEAWRGDIQAASDASGDHVWPFPLHPRYRRYVDSSFADMKNASELREGSPVLAAEFLREFAGEGPWAHLDVAGPAFLARTRGDYLWQKGGTGFGVRLFVELANRLCEPLASGSVVRMKPPTGRSGQRPESQ